MGTGLRERKASLHAHWSDAAGLAAPLRTLVSSNSLWAPVLTFLLPFAFYLRTLAPTVYEFDSAELATGAYALGIIHATGYPVYLLLGKLFTYLPFGDVGYRLNLMSAFFAALTVLTLYVLSRRLTGSVTASLAAALLFAFSRYFWSEAVAAEVYTLHTFFLAALLYILICWQESGSRRLLLLFAFVWGLSFGNHMSTLLLGAGFAYFLLATGWRQVLRPPTLLPMLLLFGLGLSSYLYLPLRYAADPPLNYAKTYFGVPLDDLSGVVWMVSGAMFRQEMFGFSLPGFLSEAGRHLRELWTTFLGIGPVIGFLGAIHMASHRRHVFVLLLLVFAANFVFFTGYRVADNDTMFLPTHLVWAIWLAAGYRDLFRRLRAWAPAGIAFALLAPLIFVFLNYGTVDLSGNRLAAEFALRVTATVEPDAFVIGSWRSSTVLEYFRTVEGVRQDITAFDRGMFGLGLRNDRARVERLYGYTSIEDLIDEKLERVPVYLLEYDPALLQSYRYTMVQGAFKLEGRREFQ